MVHKQVQSKLIRPTSLLTSFRIPMTKGTGEDVASSIS